ncbi:PAX-interacting protein 1-like isoform X5 [Clavelina lepadiformis]|uniref:PAX-interacting protein 1-like isoform X5 n=1 Tax=Clavelina lepadiformis TaxID=159417 RepID=UPI004042E322
MTQQQKTHHLVKSKEVIHPAALSLCPRRLKPKVMFTGVIDKVGENIVKELGGHLTDDMHECTHLVTDKIRRTVKFLCAIVRGLRIVNQEWFRDSKKQSRSPDPRHKICASSSARDVPDEFVSGKCQRAWIFMI